MSTDLYRVHVEKLARATVTIKLVIHDAESGNLPDGKPWALMLLCEAPKIGLAKSISAAQRIDEDFLSEAGDRFIKSVKLVAKKNYPIADAQAYNEAAHGGNPKRAAWGRYQIVVADPASLAGLRVGATWDSASYAPPPRRAAIPAQPRRAAKAPAGNLIEQLLATELVELKRSEPTEAPVLHALRAKPPLAELGELLDAPDPVVRAKALVAIRHVGMKAKSLAPKVLRSGRTAGHALDQILPRADRAAFARRELGSETRLDVLFVAARAELLGKLDPKQRARIRALCEREPFHSPDPFVWRMAAAVLEAIDEHATVFAAVLAEEPTAKGEALAAAVAAICSISTKDSKRQLAVMRAHLADPDDRVRAVALEHVWYHGETDVHWKELVAATGHPAEAIRVAAVRSLGGTRKHDAEARKVIEKVLATDRAPATLREAAADALTRLDETAAEVARYGTRS